MLNFIEARKNGVSFKDYSSDEEYAEDYQEFKRFVCDMRKEAYLAFFNEIIEKIYIDKNYFYTDNENAINDYCKPCKADYECIYDSYEEDDGNYFEGTYINAEFDQIGFDIDDSKCKYEFIFESNANFEKYIEMKKEEKKN